MFAEYLPAPVLSVGLLNFIEEPLEEPLVRKLEKLTLDLTQQLQRNLANVISRNARYFAPISPIVRIISIASDTSGLECSLPPRSGIESFHIIPYPPKTVTPRATTSNKNRAQQETGDARLYLPGNSGAPENAYRRATIVLISNSELLIVICNESASPTVGSAADAVFQAAISCAIPTIVINPQSPETLSILKNNDLHADSGLTLPDRQLQPLGGDLTDLVSQMIAPPAKRSRRAGLEDFLQESNKSLSWRFEYSLLLRLFTKDHNPTRSATPSKIPSDTTDQAGVLETCAVLDGARKAFDELAVRYGDLSRSSSVGQYLTVLIAIWAAGIVGILIKQLWSLSFLVQFVASVVVFVDTYFRNIGRWQERWLDYRLVAEKLRWLGFACMLAIGPGRRPPDRPPAWTDWYLMRMAYAAGPASAAIDQPYVESVVDHLLHGEITDQISYHRRTFRRLSLFEHRLVIVGYSSLAASGLIAIALIVATIAANNFNAVGWRPFAVVLLTAFSSSMTALNGLRGEVDLVRLSERSAQTVTLLFRARRMLRATPIGYDRAIDFMRWLSLVMGAEVEEWRSVIENRRIRRSLRSIHKRSIFSKLFGPRSESGDTQTL